MTLILELPEPLIFYVMEPKLGHSLLLNSSHDN